MANKDDMTAAEVTAAVFENVAQVFDSFIVFPNDESRTAVCLWVMHAWVFRSFDTTPRLSVRSAEPGSGKSTVLELVEHLCPNSINAIGMTPGVMWRLMDAGSPTIVLDEVDTIFGKNGSGSAHSHLRGIINAGHRKGGTVPRCVGTSDVKQFQVFGPVALGGLGRLPETIATRSVEIVMRKRKADDPKVRPFRLRFAQDSINVVRRLLESWASLMSKPLTTSLPDMPVDNRKADVWEPLVAIADAGGEDLAARARKACVVLTTESSGKPTSLGVQLLMDIRAVIAGNGPMFTHEIISGLLAIDESPWTDDNMSGRKLGRVLAEYEINSRMIRRGDKVSRGYTPDQFAAAFDRYLPTMETELV